MNRIFITLFIVFFSCSAYGQRGCCSWHGGVAGCDQNTGRIICADNSYSPSCVCPITTDKKYQSATSITSDAKKPASVIEIECNYKKIYSSNIIDRANEYIKAQPSGRLAMNAKIILEENNRTVYHDNLLINTTNKTILGNSNSWLAPTSLTSDISEYTNEIIISYFAPDYDNSLSLSFSINRTTGALDGSQYCVTPILEPLSYVDELFYTIKGTCTSKTTKRLF